MEIKYRNGKIETLEEIEKLTEAYAVDLPSNPLAALIDKIREQEKTTKELERKLIEYREVSSLGSMLISSRDTKIKVLEEIINKLCSSNNKLVKHLETLKALIQE